MSSKRAQNLALYLIEVVLLIFVSTLAGQLGLLFGFERGNVSLVWPQTGIALAVLLLYGRRLWVGVFIGALLTNFSNNTLPLIAVVGAASATISALLAIELLNRVGFHPGLRRVRDVVAFVGFAVIFSPIINATVGILGLRLEGLVSTVTELRVWFTWWLGDGIGILIVTPVILIWSEHPYRLPTLRQSAEIGLTFTVFLLVALFIFDQNLTRIGFSSLAYVIFPFLVWAALRYSQRVLVTLTLFASGVAITGTLIELSSAPAVIIWNNLLFVWSYLATMTITALLLGATLSERREFQQTLVSLEERFSKAFHSAAVATAITTLGNGYFVDVNDEYCRILGYSRSELIGHSVFDLGIWYDASSRPQYIEMPRPGESMLEIETRLVAKNGEIRNGLLTLEMIELEGVPHLLGMFRDMTDRLHADEARRDSEIRYRQLFEGIDDSIFVHDLNGNILDVNEAAC